MVPAFRSVSTKFFPVVVAIWRAAKGVEVPRPKFPVELFQVKSDFPASPKRTVEDAERPWVRRRSVVVELAAVPKLVVGVQAKEPPPVPHATPVLEMRPMLLKVAHPAGPPADETTRLVVEAVPVFVTWKTVVVELAVEDAMTKSG